MTIAATPTLAQPQPGRVGTQTDLLGECPLWDERLQCLWWVDIRAPALRRWDPARQALHTWPLPELVGSIALTERDGVVLLALRSRLALFDTTSDTIRDTASDTASDTTTARLETLIEARLPQDHRFNDGRCDRQGRFWVGTMHHLTRAPEGSLFRLDAQGFSEVIAGGIAIPNSLAFSPDGRTMYFADSLQHRIDAFDYDPASGRRGAARTFATIEAPAFPDGACVDAEGYVWSAQFHNARLVRYAPDGRVERTLAVPMKRPTCCTFGGADFGTLYVTGVSHSMSDAERAADPQAGALVAFDIGREWGIHGLPEPRLKMN